jgi:hypothetical protein
MMRGGSDDRRVGEDYDEDRLYHTTIPDGEEVKVCLEGL